jgi:hypothetical protein
MECGGLCEIKVSINMVVQLEEHGGPTLPNFSATFTNREGDLVVHGVVSGTLHYKVWLISTKFMRT